MSHPTGASETDDSQLGFDRRVRLEFRGSKISSDGGLLLFWVLDDVLGLHDLAGELRNDTRVGHNRLHGLAGLLRQSIFGRLAGYEDVNDAERLALNPVMRQIVAGRAVKRQAASASQMGRFKPEVLATPDNRTALAGLSARGIERVHVRSPLKWIARHGQLGQPDPWAGGRNRVERSFRPLVLPPTVPVQAARSTGTLQIAS